MIIPTMDRLADRMRARLTRTFVGRETELALLAESLAAEMPSVPVFLVHGPGGIGKTCLLERTRLLAAAHGIDSVRVRVRDPKFWDGAWAGGAGMRIVELPTGHDPMVSAPYASER